MNTHSFSSRTAGPLVVLAVSLILAGRATAQGSLTPPGPPAPTMKTLDQLEPRTPLAGATSTVTISGPGSYYLTGNIAVATGNGIVISADDVTLDLNGFTISSSSASINGTGVLLNGARTGVHVLNGHIRGTVTYNDNGGTFSGGSFERGIYSGGSSRSCRITGVSVVGVNVGISDDIALSFSVESCEVQTTRFSGIVGGIVSRCRAQDCGGYGILSCAASSCVVVSNSIYCSLLATTATNCHAVCIGSGAGIDTAMAESCSGQSNTGTGLNARVALNSYGYSNSGIGLNADAVTNCYGQSVDSNGIHANTASGSFGFSSNNRGISTDVANSCTGRCNAGVSFGINATHIASYSSGFSFGGTGLASYIANSCRGDNTSGPSVSASFKYNMP